MSFCEHKIGACDSEELDANTTPETKFNIQNELVWGLTYRNYKENEKKKPMHPMYSPIDIPFKLCRAAMMMKRKRLKPRFDERPRGENGDREDKESPSKPKTSQKRRREMEKPSLLDRSVWSQTKYMNFLSLPNPKFYEEPKTKKYKKRCELEPCPPRFVQLAVPNKRRVFANWKDYAHFLPTEMLLRYEEILHTDQNLDPRDARYYYKKLDRQKRKKIKRKRRLEKKKILEKEKDFNWEKAEIEQLANEILSYIKEEPLFTLNYKQLLLSDGILERLERTNIMKKPRRKTKNHYKKTIIEVADKFAVWIDTLTRFVDVQAIDSEEDIPPVSISSLLEGEGEGESSSEYESSTEDELRDDQLFAAEDAVWGEDAGEGGDFALDVIGAAEKMMEDLFKPGEGEGVTELDHMLNELDDDLLSKLIRILSNCSDEFLEGEIDADKMPGVRYQDVLAKLKELKEGLSGDVGKKPFLEQIMIDWAIRNDPDQVDDDLLRKIHEVAGLLGDFLYSGKLAPEAFGPGQGRAVEGLGEWADLEGLGEEGGVTGDSGALGQGPGGLEEGEGLGGLEEGEGPGGQEEGEGLGGLEEGEGLGGLEEGEGRVGLEEGEGSGVTPEGGDTSGAESEIDEDRKVSQGTFDMRYPIETTEAGEGGITPVETGFSDLEAEEGIGGLGAVKAAEPETFLGTDEEGKLDVLYQKEPGKDEEEVPEAGKKLDGRIIKGHKPSKVFEHSPNTVCCLSLKTWAVWLLEITHNAHSWTQWISCVIQQVREYASIVRGDVKLPNGETKVLRKAEWRKFIKETEENVVAWRQYSAHVKDLSQSIVDNFHDKKVNCCPKCLQDHLIKDVVVAHDTLQALTEAISCAAYWQRCLDTLVEKTCGLSQADKKEAEEEKLEASSESEDADLEEVEGDDSGESVYEIEGIEVNNEPPKKE